MCCESSLGLTENYWLLTCQLQGNGCAHWQLRQLVDRRALRCEVWSPAGVMVSRIQSSPHSSQVQKKDLASEKGLGDVLAWSGSVQENSAPWTALPCHSDEQRIPFQPDGSASIILLTPWTTKHPPPCKFLADLPSIISLVWFIVLHITSHEIAAIWLFLMDGKYNFKKC